MLSAQLDQLYSAVTELGAEKIAVAFSGGGDSTALLHALRDTENVTHAFIIDHNLREESEIETQRAAGFALDLGYDVSIRKWDHGHPAKGIQVKAREYRYSAMGELCRKFGITHLLTAHTEDDQAETLLMRQERGTGWRGLAGMRKEAYGPLWPALAEVTLVRPLLTVSRQALRGYNKAQGLLWIEDPSNENKDFTRVHARQKLKGTIKLKQSLLNTQAEHVSRLFKERQNFKQWMLDNATLLAEGGVEIKAIPSPELMLHILRIASGSGGPIDSARRDALCESMTQNDFKASTLAGAWVVKTQSGFLITRDKVATLGRRDKTEPDIVPVELSHENVMLWDGRFLLRANQSGIRVEAAQGHLQKLREHIETKAIFKLPKCVRPTLPVYFQGDDIIGFGTGNWAALSSTGLADIRFQSLWG